MKIRTWWIDVLAAVLATAVAVVNTLLGFPLTRAEMTLALALDVVSGLTMGGLRCRPGSVLALQSGLLIVADMLSPFTSSVSVALIATALGMLAYSSGWRAVAAGYAVAYAVLVFHIAASGLHLLAFPYGLVRLIASAALTAGPVIFGRYLRGLRQAARVAEERAAEAEARRVVEARAARLAERAQLARDLHDIVAHHVGAMTLRAGAARLALDGTGDPAVASQALADVTATGRRALDELRELLTVLRDPDAVEAPGLLIDPESAIGDAAERVRAAGVPVDVDVDARLAQAPLLVRATVARVVQEALTNVLKHAGPGTPSSVTVACGPSGTLRTRIVHGRPAGMRPSLPTSGHGLAGMRERVALLGGVLTAGPTADRGWSVSAELPGGGGHDPYAGR